MVEGFTSTGGTPSSLPRSSVVLTPNHSNKMPGTVARSRRSGPAVSSTSLASTSTRFGFPQNTRRDSFFPRDGTFGNMGGIGSVPEMSLELQLMPRGSRGTALVRAGDQWGNWAVLIAVAALSTTPLGRLFGPPLTAIALSFGLSRIGILNRRGTVPARSMNVLALQMATPLLFLRADIRDAKQRCGPLLGSFFAAIGATFLACMLGWRISGRALQRALGTTDGLAVAAALLAKNSGGGYMNYITVASTLQASPTAVVAGLCVDNIFALKYFFTAVMRMARGRPDIGSGSRERPDELRDELYEMEYGEGTMTVQNVSNVLWIAAVLLRLGQALRGRVSATAGLPWAIILTVLVASTARSKWIKPISPTAETMGTVALYVYFASTGSLGIAVDKVREAIFPLGMYLFTLYGIHGLVRIFCVAFLAGAIVVHFSNSSFFHFPVFADPFRMLQSRDEKSKITGRVRAAASPGSLGGVDRRTPNRGCAGSVGELAVAPDSESRVGEPRLRNIDLLRVGVLLVLQKVRSKSMRVHMHKNYHPGERSMCTLVLFICSYEIQ